MWNGDVLDHCSIEQIHDFSDSIVNKGRMVDDKIGSASNNKCRVSDALHSGKDEVCPKLLPLKHLAGLYVANHGAKPNTKACCAKSSSKAFAAHPIR